MKFMITGGAGFIGSHLIEELQSHGCEITVIDNLSTGKQYNLPAGSNLHFVEASILTCNSQSLKGQYDGLVHLAATPSVTQSWLEPLAAHDNNISATVAAIQLCQQLKIPRLVFASSAAVYGNPNQVPITENTHAAPISPYGLQKLVSEQYIALFSKHFGISSVCLRLFNVFGPRQDASSPYSGVISIFARAMQEGLPISINGDGRQTRDFVYVKDVASAFAKALTVPLDSGTSLVCNIGTGQAVPLIQLKTTLQSFFPDWWAETRFAEPRLGDIQHSLADISRAQEHLGFEPEWSLEAGLGALSQWLSST